MRALAEAAGQWERRGSGPPPRGARRAAFLLGARARPPGECVNQRERGDTARAGERRLTPAVPGGRRRGQRAPGGAGGHRGLGVRARGWWQPPGRPPQARCNCPAVGPPRPAEGTAPGRAAGEAPGAAPPFPRRGRAGPRSPGFHRRLCPGLRPFLPGGRGFIC